MTDTRLQAAAWVAVAVLLALVMWLTRTHWSTAERSSAACAATPAAEGQLRPAVRAAIDQLAGEPLAATNQATDSLRGSTAKTGIANPAPFTASTYVVRFGAGNGGHAVVANAELSVPHHSLVQPGVTATGGLVRLEGFDDPAAAVELTAAEIDHLLQTLYLRLCPGRGEAEAAALNRLKDVLLVVRFGAGPGLADFHRRIAASLQARSAAP